MAGLALICMLATSFGYRALARNATVENIEAVEGGGRVSNEFTKTAHSFVDSMANGDFEKPMSLFDDTMKNAVSPDKLQALWQQLNAAYGAYKKPSTEQADRERLEAGWDGHTFVFIPCQFGSTKLDLKVVFVGGNKISGFFVQPHIEEAPYAKLDEAPYVKPDAFTEESIKVGTGKWQVDGILSVPTGKGPFPVVILVHGSGPLDKDATIGPNKPFRDLAHGLASRGVAVLRYEKRTKQHRTELSAADLRTFTVKEETLDDVVAAIKSLKGSSKIDSKNIYVLGQSLGGMLIPRMAGLDNDIKGFVSLAGSNVPFDEAIAKQAEYLASLSPTSDDHGELDKLKEQAAKIKTLTESDIASGPMILGAAPAYYLDLRNHDPLKEIKNLDRPVLFLQGDRDYQVTADGDFLRWKLAIKEAGKDNLCQFKLYTGLNHLFIAGSGKSTPNEYFVPGHVDERVIADIADWITKLSSHG